MRWDKVPMPSPQQLQSEVFYKQMFDGRRRKGNWKMVTTSRLQVWIIIGTFIVGSGIVLGPYLFEETMELLGHNYILQAPATLHHTSPQWWENEWRKMNIWWRRGECREEFHKESYQLIEDATGKKMQNPASFFAGAKKMMKGSGEALPKALVPLSGDSPIVRLLAEQGYEVDAVDCSETAIRTCVEKTELGLARSLFSRIHLHHENFFSPKLWALDHFGDKGQFDFIYDRMALSCVNREERADYTYLLKKALKPDGVLYVEGVFRTGRVKGNKVRGPPFGLSHAELVDMFPERDGYFVECRDKQDAAIALLDRESKVLRKVPKELYVTPFPCVVYREASMTAAKRKEVQQQMMTL